MAAAGHDSLGLGCQRVEGVGGDNGAVKVRRAVQQDRQVRDLVGFGVDGFLASTAALWWSSASHGGHAFTAGAFGPADLLAIDDDGPQPGVQDRGTPGRPGGDRGVQGDRASHGSDPVQRGQRRVLPRSKRCGSRWARAAHSATMVSERAPSSTAATKSSSTSVNG